MNKKNEKMLRLSKIKVCRLVEAKEQTGSVYNLITNIFDMEEEEWQIEIKVLSFLLVNKNYYYYYVLAILY